MEDTPGRGSKTIKFLKLMLKVAVTIACLWYVFTKIDFDEVVAILHTANWYWLFAAFVIYALSKYFGAKRLNVYFENIGIRLREKQSLKLYWLGMFYNLFLPGAITGDAYKVILLSRRHSIAYKKTTAAVFLDRFSGLLSLGIIVAVYSGYVLNNSLYVTILISGAVLAIPVFYFIVKKFFPDFLPGFWPTFMLGSVVQLAVLFCVYFILFAMGVDVRISSYIFVFLIAAIASVLPISVGGGLGVREFVIIEGAKYAGLEQHTALMLSLLFYLITVVCSLIGALFIFKDPLEQSPQ
jgi:uncharacterized membrane protein YbhN (UPF0104 family)